MIRLHLVALLLGSVAVAAAQENPGQMGTQPQPSATNPPNTGAQTQQPSASPRQNQQANPRNPTVPTSPQTRPAGAPITDVDKPESAVGGTAPRPNAPQNLTSESSNSKAGALQLIQPNADELRNRIETALRREPSLSNATIVLNISDDTIDISGNANTPKERITARRIVQSFAGNRRVRERITVAGVTRPESQQEQLGAPNGPGASRANPSPDPQNPQQPKPEDTELQKEAAKKGDASGTPR
jgi:hypothetical protein